MKAKARHFDFSPDEYITGVAGRLRADEQGVFWMICSLVMSEGDAIDYDERRLATLCMIRSADIRRIVGRLVEVGKVWLRDGKLGQNRAQSEVERAANRIRTASENGSKGGRPPKKDQQKQDNPKPEGFTAEKLTSNEQRATTNQEDTEAKASAVADAPPDERTKLFRTGLAAIVGLTGKRESQSRSLIGRWLRSCGDDCLALNRLIEDACRDRPADPVAWIEAHLRPGTGPPQRAVNGFAAALLEMENRNVTDPRQDRANRGQAGPAEPDAFADRSRRSAGSLADGGGPLLDLVPEPRPSR